MKRLSPQHGWGIRGKSGEFEFLYCGWRELRSEAIDDHVSRMNRDWRECREHGDRTVKITIYEGWVAG